MQLSKTRNKLYSGIVPVMVLMLLVCALVMVLCPTAYAAEDWQAKYEALCSQPAIVYPASETGREFDYALITPQNAGRPDSDSIVMTLMGDGFTAEEQAKFNYYAQYFAENVLKYKPFDEYPDKIKIYRINVVSNESGITRDTSVDGQNVPGLDPRDNYFGSACWNSGLQRSLSTTSSRVQTVARGYTTQNCWMMLLMNSDVYGGTSSGGVSMTTLHDKFIDTCIHEQGHTNGGLPDEYFAGDSYFTNCYNRYNAYPTYVAKKWIDDPNWQSWSPWHRLLGKNGTTFDPFLEAGYSDVYRPLQACKMRFVGTNDFIEKYGKEQFPFCEVCLEKWRDQLTRGSSTPTLHFQPYNDQYYDNAPLTLNNKQFIFRSGSDKVYGEGLPAEDALTFTVKDSQGNVKYQDITVNTPMSLAVGTYTVAASYEGTYGKLSIVGDNTFEIKPATIIASVGNYASPWLSVDKMDTLTRPWQRLRSVDLPEVVVDPTRVGATAADQFNITYSWHLNDGNGGAGQQIGSTGTLGSASVPGPSSVGNYVLKIHSTGTGEFSDYNVVNLYPFAVETSYYASDRFVANRATYPHEDDSYFWRPITIVGEGFTEDNYDEFVAVAEDFITKFLDTTPVNHLFERFHFFIQATLSQEEGISKPGDIKNTYYGFALEDGKFTTYRTDRSYSDIIDLEVWRRDTNMKTASSWGATVVFVNDDSVQANANWRHFERNRSVHLTTIKDTTYRKLIEEIVNQFAYSISDKSLEVLDRPWMGNEEMTAETLQAMIASCYTATYPVIASDACVKTYVSIDGHVENFDVPETFKAYIYGREIEEKNFTVTYFTDDNYSVGESLGAEAPTEPGVYWAQAHLPSGVKHYADTGVATANARTARGIVRFEIVEPTYKVEFFGFGGGNVLATLFVGHGGQIDLEAVPTLDPAASIAITSWGYEVKDGENTLILPFELDTVITQDYRLLPWTGETRFKVSFMDGDTELGFQYLAEGDLAIQPEDPVKEGYTFLGWFLGEEEFDFETPITAPTVIDAKFAANTYTVAFDYNGGAGTVETMDVIFDSPYGELPETTRDDHDFIGWSTNGMQSGVVTAESLVGIAEDHTLTAIWTKGLGNLQLTTEATQVKEGDKFTLHTFFLKPVKSNAAVLDYAFETNKFAFVEFIPGDGVSEVFKEETATGMRITVMVTDYNTTNYGDLVLKAKDNSILTDEKNEITVTADYVKLLTNGQKEVVTEIASTIFDTIFTDPIKDWQYDLINLSNLIDLFGVTNEHPKWVVLYQVFDFNGNGEIDVNDIATFAKEIVL